MNKCKIYYHSLTDEMRKEEKLQWFNQHKLVDIPFEHIQPDKNNNWINQTDNDWEEMIQLCSKDVKAGKSKDSLFVLYSNGVQSNKDEWVYDLSIHQLDIKLKFYIDIYKSERIRWNNSDKQEKINNFVDRIIKWTEELQSHLVKGSNIEFNTENIIKVNYRPFFQLYMYFDKIITHRPYQNEKIFGKNGRFKNRSIFFNVSSPVFCSYASDVMSASGTLLIGGGTTQCLPFYRLDSHDNKIENISNWALEQFQSNYSDETITKEDIFNYVYGVLHNPEYRKKYELNLKREFPRIPFYDDFRKWAAWGKDLMELHINFEEVEQYPLIKTDIDTIEKPKCKLKADKTAGTITLDENTVLSGVPGSAWEYKLGNRSALEWILDQYKEKKPKDPTIAEKFNTYRFADYKDKVIDLLMRVCTVSVRTMEIVNEMKANN